MDSSLTLPLIGLRSSAQIYLILLTFSLSPQIAQIHRILKAVKYSMCTEAQNVKATNEQDPKFNTVLINDATFTPSHKLQATY